MFLYIVITISGIYLLLVITLFCMQRRLVFYPKKEIFATPQDCGIFFEDIYYETSDGIKINAWFVPADNAEFTVLFCHGNGGCLAHRVETVELYNKLGINFFIFDYRGYGLSGGRTSEEGIYLDAVAAWQFLVEEKQIPPEKIVLIGRSLGGAPASRLAAEKHPHRLICESSFISIPETGRDLYPYLPVKQLSRYKFPTGEYLTQVKCPVMIVQSREDEVVKFRHGQKLFELASPPKVFLELAGTHDDCYFDCRDQYTAAIGKFIRPGSDKITPLN